MNGRNKSMRPKNRDSEELPPPPPHPTPTIYSSPLSLVPSSLTALFKSRGATQNRIQVPFCRKPTASNESVSKVCGTLYCVLRHRFSSYRIVQTNRHITSIINQSLSNIFFDSPLCLFLTPFTHPPSPVLLVPSLSAPTL